MMLKRFGLWWEWRCLDIAAYLTAQTSDVKLAQDFECYATKAKNRLDDHDMNLRLQVTPL